MAHTNYDKHQIAVISDKNYLCFSHFVAQAMVLIKRTPFEMELNKTHYAVAKEEKLSQHLGKE